MEAYAWAERRCLLVASCELERLFDAHVLRLLRLQFLGNGRQLPLVALLLEQAHPALFPALFFLILYLCLPLHVEGDRLDVQVQELLQLMPVQRPEHLDPFTHVVIHYLHYRRAPADPVGAGEGRSTSGDSCAITSIALRIFVLFRRIIPTQKLEHGRRYL